MKNNLVNLIIFFVMLVCIIILIVIYYKGVVNECTADPLVYASKHYENRYEREFYGMGYFRTDTVSPALLFDSNGVRWQQPIQ